MKRERLMPWIEAAGAAAVVVALLLPAGRVFEPVRVAGRSMEPTMAAGDLAIVRRGAAPVTGDTVLYVSDRHGRVLHRVLRVRGDGSLETKGDANPTKDAHVIARGQVRGRVVTVVPFGRAARWARARLTGVR